MTHAPRARRKLRGEWHHPLDVDLLDLAEVVAGVASEATNRDFNVGRTFLHVVDCAGCRCHFGRLRAGVR